MTPSWAHGSPSPGGVPGSRRSSTASPVSSTRAACSRTDACAQTPPTKPSIVPSSSTSAESPGRTLVGFAARTTVAVTNGVAAREQPLHALHEIALDHCGGLPSPRIASQTREGVHGMSTCRTP